MLSDSCFDFLLETAQGKDECKTAAQLLADTRHYIKTLPIYGPEIDLLREAVEKFLAEQTPETRAHLWRTARLVQIFHDRSPTHEIDIEFETWARVELETRPEDYEWRKIRRRYLNL
jgi:uncharacterized membrane protein YgaE (UPF0421/DUF939 family)